MKSKLIKFVKILFILYVLLCTLVYFFQEKLIFIPESLPKNHKFSFNQKFEEINIPTSDKKLINGLLFKANNSKGLIFYLHGNGGNLKRWGEVAKTYTDLHYDVFIFDYRGYGKSDGRIGYQDQLFEDNQIVYQHLKKSYDEDSIIVLGYSIGTGLAARIASTNNPRMLILQAPYYNLKDLMQHRFPFLPTTLLRYQFATNEYLEQCHMPITIFHGKEDEVIYYGSALKLKKRYPDKITLIPLERQGHYGITDNKDYKLALEKLLK